MPRERHPPEILKVFGGVLIRDIMGIKHGTVDIFYTSRFNSHCLYLSLFVLGPLLLMHNEA